LYGRPFGGASGGWVSGFCMIAGSGSAAIATRLTAVAATAAPATPAPLKKSRRETMARPSL
jgi:hypothetical protein